MTLKLVVVLTFGMLVIGCSSGLSGRYYLENSRSEYHEFKGRGEMIVNAGLIPINWYIFN